MFEFMPTLVAAKNITAYPRVFRYVDAYRPKTVDKVEDMLDGVGVGDIEDRLYLTEEEQELVSFVKSTSREKRRKRVEDVDDVHARIHALEERVKALEQKCKSLERKVEKDREEEEEEEEDDDDDDDDDDVNA